jgi:hypothetical protein
MSYARASLLPPNSQNIETLKSLSKLLLEKYILLRKPDWNSYVGKFKKYLKSGVKIFSFGAYGNIDIDPWKELKECDVIKDEIEGLSNYTDVVNLIFNLDKKATSGINAEVPLFSEPSERAKTYYAIISLLQEIMRIAFPREYDEDITATKTELLRVKTERQSRFKRSLTVVDYDEKIDKLLRKIVLLGDLDVYSDAFYQKNHLFPQFTRLYGTSAYVTQADISQYTQWINTQRSKTYLRHETGAPRLREITKDQLPNVNIPYHMQPFFALIHLKKRYDLGLEDCANFAKIDPVIRPGQTFYAKFALDSKSFDAKNDPRNAAEINTEDETELLKLQMQEEDVGELEPIELRQVSIANQEDEILSDADTEELEEIDPNTIQVIEQQPTEAISNIPLPPSLPVQNSDIVDPARIPAAPTPPKVSQMGKFGKSSAKFDEVPQERLSLEDDATADFVHDESNEQEQPELPKKVAVNKVVRKKR